MQSTKGGNPPTKAGSMRTGGRAHPVHALYDNEK